MATNSRTFEVKFVGDTKGLTNSFRDIQKQAGILGKSVSGTALLMRSALAGISFVGVTRGAQQAVMAASNLAESIAKADTVFKNNSKAVQDWSKTTGRAFGVNRRAALEAAGTYGNLFRAFGISEDQAYKMSTSLVELAADMASFNNVPIDDALYALRSGLSGETEPLKRFGVAINEARMKEEALRMGLIQTTKGTLPVAIKTQAAYALIMKDTALAQGDVERTAGGLANQMKFLQAGLEDAKAGFGEILIPVVLQTITTFNEKLLPAIGDVIDALKLEGTGAAFDVLMDYVGKTITELDGVALAIYKIVTAMVSLKIAMTIWQTLPTVIGLSRAAILGVKSAVDTLRIAMMLGSAGAKALAISIRGAMISTGIGALVVAMGLLIEAFINAYLTSETFRNKVNAALGSVINVVKNLFGWISTVAKALGFLSDTKVQVDATALSAGRANDAMENVNKTTLKLGQVASSTSSAIEDLSKNLGGSGAAGGGKGGKSASAAADIASKALQGFSDALQMSKDKLASAKQAFVDFAKGVSGSISSIINFGSAANAETGTFLENLVGQAAKASEFGSKVQQLLSMGLSESAISQVLQAGADAGLKIADEIIAGGAGIVNQVNTLVAATQSLADQVGQAGAQQFYAAGIAQGEAMVAGITAALQNAGLKVNADSGVTLPEKLQKALAKGKLSKKQQKELSAILAAAGNIPAFASGGIVTGPTLALVGEAGPEAIVPLTGNKAMGNTINITVNAGMGTSGTDVGREIVDYIKRYERTAGPVFASA